MPYATIGFIKANTGTTADENGLYRVTLEAGSSNDTLVISSVGFERLLVPVTGISRTNSIIELKERAHALKEVTVSGNDQSKYAVLNDFPDSVRVPAGQIASIWWPQMAQLFRAPVPNTRLSSIRILTDDSDDPPKKSVFRLRVYSVDSTSGAPSIDLYTKPIDIDLHHKRISEVDLERYHIVIPDTAFFVAVEWIKSKKTRVKFNSDHDSFGPAVGLRWTSDSTMVAWMSNYRGEWNQITTLAERSGMLPQIRKTSMIMSAKVRY